MRHQATVFVAFVGIVFSTAASAGFTPTSNSCSGIEKRIKLIEKALKGSATQIKKQRLESELEALKRQKSRCQRTGFSVAPQ